jgi:hypothetical protein
VTSKSFCLHLSVLHLNLDKELAVQLDRGYRFHNSSPWRAVISADTYQISQLPKVKAMNKGSSILINRFVITAIALLLTACGGGSGGGGADAGTGLLTVSVTDKPINESDIAAVCIAFSRITVHHTNSGDIVMPYNPSPPQVTPETHCMDVPVWDGISPVPPVRLDALGGPVTVALAESIQIPEGRVTWVRLHLIPGESYVEDNVGAQHSLICQSCEPTDNNQERGFKLNRTFEVPADVHIAMMVDIDLRKSLTQQGGSDTYILRPTARMDSNENLGTVAGEVNETVITSLGGTTYTGSDIDTGCAAYVYAGHNATPDDYYLGSPVISTAGVKYDIAMGVYRYAMGALVGGTASMPEPYTIALTCDADDPQADDSITFTEGKNADVTAGETWTTNF